MKKLLIVILSLSLIAQQNIHTQENPQKTSTQKLPIIRTALGLGLGVLSARCGRVSYRLMHNATDSTIGGLFVGPFVGVVAAATGVGSYMLLNSATKTTTNDSIPQNITNIFKKFW